MITVEINLRKNLSLGVFLCVCIVDVVKETYKWHRNMFF